MKVVYKSKWYKVVSVLRFYILRLFYGKKLTCDSMSMIGKRCGIYIKKQGSIHCSGRMIINDDVMLFAKGEINVGNNLGINQYSRIVAHKKITLGSNVTIGQMVGILDHDHDYSMDVNGLKLSGYIAEEIKIGNNVWIGDKVSILKGVTIGDNVIVGAHTLVNKDVPSNTIIGGNPFKVLKEL